MHQMFCHLHVACGFTQSGDIQIREWITLQMGKMKL